MKCSIRTLFLLLASLAAAVSAQCNDCGSGQKFELNVLLHDKELALKDPDQFNWRVLAFISVPVDSKPFQATNNKTVTPNNVLWETWADDDYTFPISPDPGKSTPTWCDRHPTIDLQTNPLTGLLKLAESKLIQASDKSQHKEELPAALVHPIGGGFAGANGEDSWQGEEVRRNKTAFDFIVDNHLWYQEGLAERAFDNAGKRRETRLEFPEGSIEIKAYWRAILESQKPRYHWNYGANGKLYGLLGLHIITRTLPDWTWATWEHVDNTGRCDEMGCFDDFGSETSVVNPAATSGQLYPPGTPSLKLTKLFRKTGVKPEWENYRLKGSQINPNNRLRLGNSVIEIAVIPTSSCIACHSRASVLHSGATDCKFGTTKDSKNNVSGPVGEQPPLAEDHFAVDFVWAFFQAHSIKPEAGGCQSTPSDALP